MTNDSHIIHRLRMSAFRLSSSIVAALLLTSCGKEEMHPNFHAEVSPIFTAHCTTCHYSDGATPFSLTTYKDSKQHVDEIARVIQKGTMPPWLPVHKSAVFRDKPVMNDADRKTILQWIALGAPEGKRSRTTREKDQAAASTWQIGEPDLIIEFPSFTHAESDQLTIRTLVADIPTSDVHHVRAMEFLPHRAKAIEHALLLIDSGDASTPKDASDPSEGYIGKALPTASAPNGNLMFWKAGKKIRPVDPGLTWALHPDDTLAVELSLRPVNTAETVSVRVGIHFSGSAPSKHGFGLKLHPTKVGEVGEDGTQKVFDFYTLPVDATLTRFLPDIEFPCKSVSITVGQPAGKNTKLLSINDWNSAHQDEYILKDPYFLKKGTTLRVELNCEKGALPPTTDQAALWAQVLVKDAAAIDVLQEDSLRYILANHPTASHHYKLAQILQGRRSFAEAIEHYQAAIRLPSPMPDTHQQLAYCQMNTGQFKAAFATTEHVLLTNPADVALLNLRGKLLMALNRPDEARAVYEKVVGIDPENTEAQGQINLLKHRETNP